MMTPNNECGFGVTDRGLMEILMELGSAHTIFSSLCRSIERLNPGIAVALLHHDRQSEELEVLAAPSMSDQFVASLSGLSPSLDDASAADKTSMYNSKDRWRSGRWQAGVDGPNVWWLEAKGSNYESTVSLLAVDQCAENLPAALDIASIRSAMRLANRIFARHRVNMPQLGSREMPTVVNYTN
jgi:hypothetical protein